MIKGILTTFLCNLIKIRLLDIPIIFSEKEKSSLLVTNSTSATRINVCSMCQENHYKLFYVSEDRITFSYMAVIDDWMISCKFVWICRKKKDFLLVVYDKYRGLTSKEGKKEDSDTDGLRQNCGVINSERNSGECHFIDGCVVFV
jgi:hypothetical protein